MECLRNIPAEEESINHVKDQERKKTDKSRLIFRLFFV